MAKISQAEQMKRNHEASKQRFEEQLTLALQGRLTREEAKPTGLLLPCEALSTAFENELRTQNFDYVKHQSHMSRRDSFFRPFKLSHARRIFGVYQGRELHIGVASPEDNTLYICECQYPIEAGQRIRIAAEKVKDRSNGRVSVKDILEYSHAGR